MKGKILFLIDSLRFGGGAERVVSTLSHALAEDYEIHVLTFVIFKDIYPISGKYYSLNENRNESLRLGTLKKFNFLKRIYQINKYIKEISPDIIISFMEYANIFSIIAKMVFRIKIPLIISIHCNPLIQYKKSSRYLNFLIKLLYPLKVSNKIVVVSKKVNEIMRNSYRIKKEQIQIIHNPVDIKLIDVLKKKKVEIDPLINAEKVSIKFINVSNLRFGKGHGILINTFSKVKKKLPGAKLLLIGEGSLRNEIQNNITNLGLNDDIKLLGLQKNPFKFIYNSDIFVFPSLHEGFGLILLETLVCEIPIISFKCKVGPKEILQDGKYGILVPVGDVDELAAKMIELANDKNLRVKYSSISRERANDFDVQKIKKKWTLLINQLIAKSKTLHHTEKER